MVPGSIQRLEVGTCAAPAAEIHASKVVYSFALFQRVRVIAVTQHLWSVLYRCLLQGVRTVVGLPLVSN